MRRRAAAVAGALAAVALPATGARAAPLSACTPTRGTVVAVDFGHFGGPVVRGCGVGATSGFGLLHAAGFTSAGDQHDGPAFICRLGDSAFRGGSQYPTPAQDPCIQTPPTSAYWSFWTARAGQDSWHFSSVGAMSDAPSAGEVELWTFGATDGSGTRGRPAVSPASLRPRPSTAAVTTATQTTRRAAAPPIVRTTSTSTTRTRAAASPGRIRSRAHRARARHGHPATATASTTTTTSSAAIPVVAATPTRATTSDGSTTSLLAGLALAALLCGGAGWATWRRRRQS